MKGVLEEKNILRDCWEWKHEHALPMAISSERSLFRNERTWQVLLFFFLENGIQPTLIVIFNIYSNHIQP